MSNTREKILDILNKKSNPSFLIFEQYFKEINRIGYEEFKRIIMFDESLLFNALNAVLDYYKNKYQIIKLEGPKVLLYY